MRAAPRGTSSWRRPTEQVIPPQPPAQGRESRRALTQGTCAVCSPRCPRTPVSDSRRGLWQGTSQLAQASLVTCHPRAATASPGPRAHDSGVLAGTSLVCLGSSCFRGRPSLSSHFLCCPLRRPLRPFVFPPDLGCRDAGMPGYLAPSVSLAPLRPDRGWGGGGGGGEGTAMSSGTCVMELGSQEQVRPSILPSRKSPQMSV